LSSSIERPSLYNEEKTISKEAQGLLNTLFQAQDKESNEYKGTRVAFDTNLNVGVVRQNNTLDYSSLDKREEAKVEEKSRVNSSYYDEDAFSFKFPKAEAKRETPRQETPQETEKSSQVEISFDIETNTQKIDTPVAEIPREEPKIEEKILVPDYKIIGELYNSYVIVETGDIAYIIDKHAAHERIIFEDLKKKLTKSEPSSQMLLFPIEAELTSNELSAICEWEEDIKKTGFGYTLNGNTISISEIPAEIEVGAAQDAFLTLLDKLSSGEADASNSRYARFERALYQCSCKAAIKAGRIYDGAHIKWICDRVLTLDNIKYCPHGRPIAFEITKHFLEKQFERK
jgi:DNA mismatch repair protein MutL